MDSCFSSVPLQVVGLASFVALGPLLDQVWMAASSVARGLGEQRLAESSVCRGRRGFWFAEALGRGEL